MKIRLLSTMLVAFWAGSAYAQSYPVGDLNGDGDVNFEDLRLFADRWLDESCLIPGCDADMDGVDGVNMADFALLAENFGSESATVVISEFMASNGSKLPLAEGELLDEDDDSSDWIEIYNSTDHTVNLGGWYLTNNAGNLEQWQFPNGIVLNPGQFLIVFASGKDRRIAGSELHTNFNLDINGEYLALVKSDGVTVAHEFEPEFPQQLTDISYGLAQYGTALVPTGATASYKVPALGDAGKDWTALGFDDSTWKNGPTSIGFGQSSLGFEVICYQANTTIGDLSTAELVISNPTYQSVVAAETAPVINYLNTGGSSHFGNDNPFPGTTIGNDVEDFAVLVTGKIMIPQTGDWTFGVNSDDGFTLELSNGTYTMTFSHPELRSAGDTLATFNFAEWGHYDLRLVFYERGGDSSLEFFVAQGSHSSFNSNFSLVGDIANGGLYVISSGSDANTDVEQQMHNVNASIWTRIVFEGEEVDYFDSLALRMRYEDAFVAYLNGAEVAKDNFTGTPEWNSVADGDRPNELAAQFVHYDISNYVNNLREGSNVLAVHGLNDNKTDGEFLILPEMLVASNRMMPQYFSAATPGQFNSSGSINLVADTKFSHDRGFYDAPFKVAITCQTPWATIRYTTDGSAPTETHGQKYTNPITIYKTTCLRAMAFKPGWMPTDVDTQTYIFLDNVISQSNNPSGFPTSWGGTGADYEMDPAIVNSHKSTLKGDLLSIPTMSLVMKIDDFFGASEGIYANPRNEGFAWERPGSIELIDPDGSRQFQVNCGVRIYGGVGRNEEFKKKTLRLLFKREYGPTKLRYPLFGDNAADEFNTIILRANFNDAYVWGGADSQYIRDEVIRRLQLDLGGPAPYGDFVHLYVNGLYWGLYNPVERPDTAFSATYFGGDKEDWDGINSGQPTGGGQRTTWNALMSLAGQGLDTTEAYQQLQGNNPDGTNNPDYEDYLDIENYISFLLANYYGGNNDWMSHNWYAGRLRGPESTGWKSYTWDAEWVMGMHSVLNDNAVNDTSSSNYLIKPHTYLRYNTEYLMLFADLAHKAFFNGGPLYVDPSNSGWDPGHPERNRPAALYAELADLVERAMIAESARWGDVVSSSPYNINQWRNVRNWVLNTYTPQRSAVVLDQLRNAGLYPNVDAPVFHINGSYQHGGEISPTDMLSMIDSAGKIYYTIDGNDARLPTDPVDIVNSVNLVVENDFKRVLVPTGNIGTNWRTDPSFNDSTWIGGTRGVGYERGSGYASLIGININTQMSNNTSCYVRIPFTVDAADLAGFNFMRLKMRYDDGFVAYINGEEIHRATFTGTPYWNSIANGNHEADSLESFNVSDHINALKAGDNILAIQGLNVSIGSSDFIISAELLAGESTLVNEVLSDSAIEYTGPITLTESTHIKSRVLSGATWSALNEATFAVGPVADNLRITEIMYNPQDTNEPNDPNEEFIELKNIAAVTLNLNLVQFTNGIDFTFPSVELEAGEYILVVKDIEAFAAQYGIGYKIAGQYSGSLNNAGERIELEDAAGQTIHNFRYRDGWYDITDGMGFSLTIKDPTVTDPNEWESKSGWRPSADIGGSPGWDDTGDVPGLGDVVINEILAHSHAGAPDWIELHNTTGASINIGGWFLSDSSTNFMKYEIAAGTTIEPNGYIVFYEDVHFGPPAAGSDPGNRVPFALSENGETLYLHSGADGVLTGYSEEEDFDASETGIAFGRYRKSTGTYNFVAMSENTPNSANAYPQVGPLIINEIMYNPFSGNQDAEYIELLNISGSAVILDEYDNEQLIDVPWRLTDSDGISFDFPLGTTMAAGEYLLLVKDKDVFNSQNPAVPGGTQIFEWGGGRLDNGGEKVQLSKPGDELEGTRYYIRVDRVNYSDGSHPVGEDPWPIEPDGYGKSLTRKVPADYGNDVDNWQAATPSPGE